MKTKTKAKTKAKTFFALFALAMLCGPVHGAVNYETPSPGDAWASRAVCSGFAIDARRSTADLSVALPAFDSRMFSVAMSGWITPFSSMKPGFLLFLY